MESQKNKLLTLAKSCLTNSDFYGHNFDSKSTHIIHRVYENYTQEYAWKISREDYARHTHFLSPNNEVYDLKTEKYCKEIKENKLKKNIGSLNISFSDQPPLVISAYFYPKELEKETFYVEALQSINKTKEISFNLFSIFRKKKIESPATPDLIKYNASYTKMELECKIRFGSIEEGISEEEFNELSQMYVDNKKRLAEENDLKKLDERLKQYSK